MPNKSRTLSCEASFVYLIAYLDFLAVVALCDYNGENYVITSLPNSEHKRDQLNA